MRERLDEVFVSSVDFSFIIFDFCAAAAAAESSVEGSAQAYAARADALRAYPRKASLPNGRAAPAHRTAAQGAPVRRPCALRALTGQSAHPESLLPDHFPNATRFAPTGHRYCQTLRTCEHQASHSPPSLYLSNQVKCYTYFSHFNKSSLQCILARNNFMRLASREMPYSWAISLCDSRYS